MPRSGRDRQAATACELTSQLHKVFVETAVPVCMQNAATAPPVHMIKLTETREITPYRWVHPDKER
jgi:hypothetical protein